jgi:hypothetical protein
MKCRASPAMMLAPSTNHIQRGGGLITIATSGEVGRLTANYVCDERGNNRQTHNNIISEADHDFADRYFSTGSFNQGSSRPHAHFKRRMRRACRSAMFRSTAPMRPLVRGDSRRSVTPSHAGLSPQNEPKRTLIRSPSPFATLCVRALVE